MVIKTRCLCDKKDLKKHRKKLKSELTLMSLEFENSGKSLCFPILLF